MIVYYSSDLTLKKVYSNLQANRSTEPKVNFLACPAVRDLWNNTFSFSTFEDFSVKYKKGHAEKSNNAEITFTREPQLNQTNIFNLCFNTWMFAESSLEVQASSPFFEKAEYQKQATFIGGIYNIGKWYRTIQSEIITWDEEGEVFFNKKEPLFYVKFLTDEPIQLVRYQVNEVLGALSANLIRSPFNEKPQGTLEGRYDSFEQSSYREAILEEIKANLVSKDEASPSV